MSRSQFNFNTGTIGQLEANYIQIVHDKTNLKWSGRLKNKDISLINGGSTAKLDLLKSGEKALLASKGVNIGSEDLSWSLDIYKGRIIQCGIALISRDLTNTTPGTDLLSTRIDVAAGDRIILSLSSDSNTLLITKGTEKQSLDTSYFTGQTMYPWISDIGNTSGFSIKINQYQVMNLSIDQTGTARIDTATSSVDNIDGSSTAPLIIDTGEQGLELGVLNITNSNIQTQPGEDFSVKVQSGQGITVQDPDGNVQVDTKIQVDAIEPKSGSTSLTITGGGSDGLVVDTYGDVTVDPGCVITSAVKAPLGSDSSLINNSGLGLTVSDTSGNVTVTGASLVCDELTSNSLLKIGATSTKVEVASTGVVTEVKGNLDVSEGLDVIGNITVTGTINGTSVGSGSISNNTDVTVTAPSDNQILQYDNASSLWVNRSLATAGVAADNHTHTASDITDFNTATDERITAQKGNVNGLATLDATGKVPLTQIALNSVEFIGTWDANTNNPTLTSGSGTKGNYYVVNVAGATNLDSITDWQIGDWAIYNGTVWQKVDNTDSVTSVAGKQGAVTLQATDLTDITDAGSGAIITTGERTAISTLSSTYLTSAGGVMSGSIDMTSNNLTNVGTVSTDNNMTVSNTLTVTNVATFEEDCKIEGDLVLNTGVNQVTLSAGTSTVARSYSIQDKGVTGSLVVIAGNTIGPMDDNDNNSVDASFLEISGANKTAGTGNGGNLVLRGGSSVGGVVGHIEFDTKVNFAPQTQPNGFAGDVYYDSVTNKLRVYNGSVWVDLHP